MYCYLLYNQSKQDKTILWKPMPANKEGNKITLRNTALMVCTLNLMK